MGACCTFQKEIGACCTFQILWFFMSKNKYSFKMLENAKNSKRSKFVRELRLAMEDQTARGGGGKVDPCTWTSGIDS
jgi:hypothetical protein